jgi:predicted ester cyclase
MDDVGLTREFFRLIEAKDTASASKLISGDFVFSGPVPEPIDGPAYLDMQDKLAVAFPDWSFNMSDVHQHGDVVHATVQITGTHNGDLDLAPLGMPVIPPTGKSVELPREEVTVRCENGKITAVINDPVPGGGVQGVLGQIGVKIPTS